MTRQGPPAPVVDRSGIYFTAPAADVPPITAAPRARVSATAGAQPFSNPPARRGGITAVELPPPPRTERSIGPASPPARRPVVPAKVDASQAMSAAGGVSKTRAGRVQVRAGDTLYSISRREQVPLRALIDANSLKPPYGLRPGQTLTVPAVRVYVVVPGDTVAAVARRFDVGIGDVIRQNDLKAPDFGLFAGQRLVLPWRGSESGTAAVRAEYVTAPERASVRAMPEPPSPRIELADPDADPPKRAAGKFLWPVRGKVVSGFGSKGGGLYNDGINIAAAHGDIVRAAENGIVAYSGNELRGYGNLLLVRHADGWVSAYAHNGELLVKRGQVVKRGQPIARVGRSGAVAQPQLHFELRRGRKAVDPSPHLS